MAETEEPKKKKKIGETCKKVLKFLFSHIGLCSMVVGYSVAGGFIFEHLEKHNEWTECVKARDQYLPKENETIDRLMEIVTSTLAVSKTEEEFNKTLRTFRLNVLEIGYDGKDCDNMGEKGGPSFQWTFPGALLFSVTVITTIGYGNIAPKTFWGRLVCIAYATLGIPLMLLCLANIGDVMADIFRFIYAKVCCCGCCRRRDKTKVVEIDSPSRGGPAWNSGKGDIGFNPGQNAPVGADPNKPRPPSATSSTRQRSSLGSKSPFPETLPGPPPPRAGPMIIDDDSDDEDEEDEKITVPLTITMVVIAGYIFGGALLFGVWEAWPPLKASYFCFVTLTTIGFGDVVPGAANFETSQAQVQMILSSVYMLFGMAIVSMCFSLMQDEIVAKFTWVGQKLGIIDKKKVEDDEE
ncbi:unnamed protein product [Owenia fusiformis]|uniref:Potassium channel domain-containing protein n=1 Tax=Owenia fusiformis TaxID=6347 RepID=A0A8S4PYY9_OWEFU|nr:unnamed protein product [Owenia fusiformis]